VTLLFVLCFDDDHHSSPSAYVCGGAAVASPMLFEALERGSEDDDEPYRKIHWPAQSAVSVGLWLRVVWDVDTQYIWVGHWRSGCGRRVCKATSSRRLCQVAEDLPRISVTWL